MIPDIVLVLMRSSSTTTRSIAGQCVPCANGNPRRRRQWFRFKLSLPLYDHLLMAIQHYKAQHRIECPKCSSRFTTRAEMDQVAFYPIIPDSVLVLMRPFSTTKQSIPFLNALSATANSILRRLWTRLVFNPVLDDHTLTFFQHYGANHRFGCPKCDDEFTTQAAVNQVSFPSAELRLGFFTHIRSTTI